MNWRSTAEKFKCDDKDSTKTVANWEYKIAAKITWEE